MQAEHSESYDNPTVQTENPTNNHHPIVHQNNTPREYSRKISSEDELHQLDKARGLSLNASFDLNQNPFSNTSSKYRTNSDSLESNDLFEVHTANNPISNSNSINPHQKSKLDRHRRQSNKYRKMCKIGLIDFAKVKYNDPKSDEYVENLYRDYQVKWLTAFDNLIVVWE